MVPDLVDGDVHRVRQVLEGDRPRGGVYVLVERRPDGVLQGAFPVSVFTAAVHGAAC